jgi:hypothetical protein
LRKSIIFLLIASVGAVSSCQKNTDSNLKNNPHLSSVTLEQTNVNSLEGEAGSTMEYLDPGTKIEGGGKAKWYISKKAYRPDGTKYCPGGFGLCKGTVTPYIKVSRLSQEELGYVLVDAVVYQNAIQIYLPEDAPEDYKSEEFRDGEIMEFEDRELGGQTIFGIRIVDGRYDVRSNSDGRKYLMLPYSIVY